MRVSHFYRRDGNGSVSRLPWNEYHCDEAKTYLYEDGAMPRGPALELVNTWNRVGIRHNFHYWLD